MQGGGEGRSKDCKTSYFEVVNVDRNRANCRYRVGHFWFSCCLLWMPEILKWYSKMNFSKKFSKCNETGLKTSEIFH